MAAQAVIGTGGSIASGIIGSGAAKDAAKALEQAGYAAIGTEQQSLNDIKNLYNPYVTGGANAFADLQKLLGIGQAGGPSSPLLQMLGIGGPGGVGGTGAIDPTKFQASPGYQFQVQQGQNAVTNSAQGNLGGNTLRALMQQGQQTANQGWQQYLGNVNSGWNSLLSGVGGVANTGFNAASGLAGDTMSINNNIASERMGIGNAQAGGIEGSAQAIQGMIKGIVSALSGATGGMGGGGGGGGGGFASMFG